jgi:hypothetical protein
VLMEKLLAALQILANFWNPEFHTGAGEGI